MVEHRPDKTRVQGSIPCSPTVGLMAKRKHGCLSSCARSGEARQNNMFYVYFLKSELDSSLYIGYTTNLKARVANHLSGKVKSTKSKLPVILVGYEAYKEKLDATSREKFLKSHQQRDSLKERFKNSLARW